MGLDLPEHLIFRNESAHAAMKIAALNSCSLNMRCLTGLIGGIFHPDRASELSPALEGRL
jgi:hypothetical protein